MLKVDLHPFQDSAVDKMLARGNLLLAYEMGLGKTVCAVAVIEDLLAEEAIDMAIVVVPSNLKFQWAQQIAKLTDVDTRVQRVKADGVWQEITVPTDEYCLVVDGDKDKRHRTLALAKETRPDYLILTYENVVNDWDLVRRLEPGLICLDEATAIKTFKAQRTRKIKRFTAPYRLALTGTPVENGKPEELFSIMQWVDDDVLGRWDLFDKAYVVRNAFGAVQRYKNMPVLHAKLSMAMERKTRRDPEVAPYLPDVEEIDIRVSMDKATRVAYDHIAEDLLSELRAVKVKGSFDLFAYYHGKDGGDNSEQGRIMARMQALDMLLCHPRLLTLSAQRYEQSALERQAGRVKKTWPGSAYAAEVASSGVLEGLDHSAKLDALVTKVKEIVEWPNNKVIIFSAWRDMADIITENLPGIGIVHYHGGMSAGEKAAAQAQFTTDPGTQVFLASHAGAYGTDLYAANYLINYDLSWQAGKQDQINARHVRASSEWDDVYVINLLTRDSTEIRRYDSLTFKRTVGASIIDNDGADERGRVENDVASLTTFLTGDTNGATWAPAA